MSKIKIKTTEVSDVIKALYNNSKPQGLGFLHYKEGEIESVELLDLINDFNRTDSIYLDYVAGRAVKCSIKKEDDGFVIGMTCNQWYDHSPLQIQAVLSNFAEWEEV